MSTITSHFAGRGRPTSVKLPWPCEAAVVLSVRNGGGSGYPRDPSKLQFASNGVSKGILALA